MNTVTGTQKSIFGGGQTDLDKISELLNEYNDATTKLPKVETVQDIIVITNSLSKLIQKTSILNTNNSIIKSK